MKHIYTLLLIPSISVNVLNNFFPTDKKTPYKAGSGSIHTKHLHSQRIDNQIIVNSIYTSTSLRYFTIFNWCPTALFHFSCF